MENRCFSVVRAGVAVAVAMLAVTAGCGGGGGAASTPPCGTANTCEATDPVCARPCGQGRVVLCQCGVGLLAGMLTCDTVCMREDTGSSSGGAGGRLGRGTGGVSGTGGASGLAGRTGRGGATAVGGRVGRGTGGGTGAGGVTGQGGRVGRGTGGVNGTGGFTPSDAGTPICPADVAAGGVACTPSATPTCQTACVNGMYNICTCVSGGFVCPTNQIVCP